MLSMFGFTQAQQTGAVMAGLGFLFMLVSMLFFFERGLLVIGNVLVLSGVTMILGVPKTLQFFNPFGMRTYEKTLGIVLFFSGFAMLLANRGWVVLDFVLELIGLFQMFGSFLPKVLGFLRLLPYIGPVLSAPYVKEALDWIAEAAPKRQGAGSKKGAV